MIQRLGRLAHVMRSYVMCIELRSILDNDQLSANAAVIYTRSFKSMTSVSRMQMKSRCPEKMGIRSEYTFIFTYHVPQEDHVISLVEEHCRCCLVCLILFRRQCSLSFLDANRVNGNRVELHRW